MTEHVSWDWIFFINVPVGAVGSSPPLVVQRVTRHGARAASRPARSRHVRARALPAHLRPDRVEQLRLGVDPHRGLFAVAASPSSPSCFWSRTAPADARPLALQEPTFAGGNMCGADLRRSMFGDLLLRRSSSRPSWYSPMQAGATFLPWTVPIAISRRSAGKLSDRIGSRWLVTGGMTLVAASLSLSRGSRSMTFWDLLPAMHPRRRRDVVVDGADDRDGDGRGAARQGRRRLGGAEQHTPGRRLARDRDHGRDRRATVTSADRPAGARSSPRVQCTPHVACGSSSCRSRIVAAALCARPSTPRPSPASRGAA